MSPIPSQEVVDPLFLHATLDISSTDHGFVFEPTSRFTGGFATAAKP
jgi:hypothetical protein